MIKYTSLTLIISLRSGQKNKDITINIEGGIFMKTKRRRVKILMGCLVLIVAIAIVAVSSNIIYEKSLRLDDSVVRENYEAEKENYELLKTIAEDCIEEGKGINTQKILNEDICFKVYNKGENIIFHYYIDEENFDNDPIKATITLSKDYKILDEEYAEISSYENYERNCQISRRSLSVVLSLISCMILGIVFMGVAGIRPAVKRLIKFFKTKKSHKAKNDS